jgi:hypothetical protein
MTAVTIAAQLTKNWETSLLRATAFPTGPLDLASVKWWEVATGRSSESKNIRTGIGQLIEVGTVDDKVLQLQIQPGRIDWVLALKDDPESEKFSSLGDFDKSSNYFRELIVKWLEQAPPLNRIAFGAVLSIPTKNESEAMETISRFLPYVKIDWSGVRDFIFQMNLPQPCATFPGLGAINRLVKWQNVVRQKVIATLSPPLQAPVATTQEPAAQCELDISTAVSTETAFKLPPDQLKALFAELVQHAAEVMPKGDIL